MKKNLLFLAFALLAGQGFAQNVDSLVVAREVDSLLTAAVNLRKAGKNVDALPIAQRANDIAKERWGENNVLYAATLYRLATIYSVMRQYDKAETMFLKVIDLRAALLGKDHPDYALSVYSLGLFYDSKGDYAKAELRYLEAKEIRGRVLGKENLDYAQTLNSLGINFQKKGDYANAEPILIEAGEIRGKILGKNHPDYAACLHNLGIMYFEKGDFTKAEQLYLESKAIVEKALGNQGPDYASSLTGLAILYRAKGEYAKAEPLYLEAVAIRAKTLGKESPDYAGALNNLASFYRLKGDYAKAEPLYLESKEIRAKFYGKEHPLYAQSLNNLANLYYFQGDLDKAEPLYLESKEIRAKILGKDHLDYAQSLSNLGAVYHDKGDYVQAESLFWESAGIWAKKTGKNHPEYAKSLSNLSSLYLDKGEYAKVEPLQLEAKEIWANTLGKDNEGYAESLNNLAHLYLITKRIPESAAHFLELDTLNRRLIEESASYSSENQMLTYLRTFDRPLAQFPSFLQAHPSPELAGTAYDNALFFNGFLLENARRLSSAVFKADSATNVTYEHWQGSRRRLAREYAKPIAERRLVAETEAESEGYEKILTRSIPLFQELRKAPHWQDVQAQLQPGEAAVEFIHYTYHNFKPTDSTMYAALVLRPGDTAPKFVPLFEASELAPLLKGAAGGSNFKKINALYARNTEENPQKSPYELIWKPLEPLLKGSKTVYCAPSGLLHRINLAAIPTDDGQLYGLLHQTVVLGSTRQLITTSSNPTAVRNDGYLLGGVRYDSDSSALVYANRGITPPSTVPATLEFEPDSVTMTRGDVLHYLPGSAAEVKEIGSVLKRSGFQVRIDTGFYATEESFRQLGLNTPSPRILHLATHGYFFPDPGSKEKKATSSVSRDPVFKLSDHPMIRSGLILAGANQAWLTGKHPEGQEDGILTAYEISQMNLSGTELVVLSACETGLGDIVGNEGVYGLQRAFKIAGARYLIMSLWKVDDRSSREFMTGFYRHWLTEKQTIPKAFRTTQREMRAKYSGAYDWAGFVLIE